MPDVDGEPWRFTTRQFTNCRMAIAHQPFGVVAGRIQYKHAQVAIFEGLGTSASGFPAEIEDERRLARLESFRDRYEDFKAGAATTPRLAEQFTRIRSELGDFPGRVAGPARLRAMLANAAAPTTRASSTTATSTPRPRSASGTCARPARPPTSRS